MSFQLDVRMARFPMDEMSLVHRPGISFSIPGEWGSGFEPALSLATVHWSADPALGLPVAPYRVDELRAPLAVRGLEANVADVDLAPANGLTADFTRFVRSIEMGLFYVRLEIDATDPVDLYAIDLAGNEIASSRRHVAPGVSKMFFFGPGLFGLQSTAPVRLIRIRAANLIVNNEMSWRTLAEVAPAIEEIAVYNRQAYLGQYDAHGTLLTPLNASDALVQRLTADALARANTEPPRNAELERDVHRTDPAATADIVLRSSLVNTLRTRFADFLADPTLTYSERLLVNNGPETDIQVRPVPLLQFLGACGPAEACALGAGVTIPVMRDLLREEAMYDAFEDPDATMEIPVVRVTGYFAGSSAFVDAGDVDVNRAHALAVVHYARVTPRLATPVPVAQTVSRIQPEVLDGPAYADVELAFAELPRADALFMERQIGGAANQLLLGEHGPKAFLAVEVDPPMPPYRLSRVLDPEIPLPFVGNEIAHYVLHRRDEFGRWNLPVSSNCTLEPWPVAAPTLISSEVSYGGDGTIWLALTLSWNWQLRRPQEIRFGMRIAGNATDATLDALNPADGVTAPMLGQQRTFRLLFSPDPAQLPRIEHQPISTSAPLPRIAFVSPPAPEPAGPDAFDRAGFVDRTYRLRVPLGSAQSLFTQRERCTVAIVADALELVSGPRRSRLSRRLFQDALDPRPPQIRAVPWHLVWSSRPNAANEARAVLPPPQIASGTCARFNAWRAHESSIIDLLLASRAEWAGIIALIRREENMAVRLGLLKGLVDQIDTTHPAFRRDFIALFSSESSGSAANGPMEVRVSGATTGLELFLITATSKTGIDSDKMQLADLRAVAVPRKRKLARPALQIVMADDQSLFELTGTCLFVVSSQDPFDASHVHAFWEEQQDVMSSDELFLPFKNLWPVSTANAKVHVADIERILDHQPFAFRQLFVATPPRRWLPQSFAVDLRPPASGAPADDIPSPRSAVARCLVPPTTKPTLLLSESQLVGAGATWKIALHNLPLIAATDIVGRSEIHLELTLSSDHKRRSTTSELSDLASNAIQVTVPEGSVTAHLDSSDGMSVATDFDLGNDSIRLIARDPLYRATELILRRPTPEDVS